MDTRDGIETTCTRIVKQGEKLDGFVRLLLNYLCSREFWRISLEPEYSFEASDDRAAQLMNDHIATWWRQDSSGVHEMLQSFLSRPTIIPTTDLNTFASSNRNLIQYTLSRLLVVKIVFAVARHPSYYSKEFLREIEKYSPMPFSSLMKSSAKQKKLDEEDHTITDELVSELTRIW